MGQLWKCTARGEFQSCEFGYCSSSTSSIQAESSSRTFAEQTAIELCQQNLKSGSSVCQITSCQHSGIQNVPTPVSESSQCPKFDSRRLYRRTSKYLEKLHKQGLGPVYEGYFFSATPIFNSETSTGLCRVQDEICENYYESYSEFKSFLRLLRSTGSNKSRLGRSVQKYGRAVLRATKRFCS